MPLSRIYGVVTNLRNRLYDRRILRSHPLGARTISVGNITAGGTGKTPLVAYIARSLAERGERVCILTRGYGRRDADRRVLVSDGKAVLSEPESAGDEPVELARRLLGKAIVIADADRVSAAEWARKKFGVTAFILDDGFQHRKAARDLDIVCIDATDPFGGGKMLPIGRLREPVRGISRAEVVIITRSDLADNIDRLKDEISSLNPVAKIFMARNAIVRVTELKDFLETGQEGEPPAENANGSSFGGHRRLGAFCGIGNPKSFFQLLSNALPETQGSGLLLMEAFPDHHKYTQLYVDKLQTSANEVGIEALVTTAKDAVKLKHLDFAIPCFVVEIDVMLGDPDEFAELL